MRALPTLPALSFVLGVLSACGPSQTPGIPVTMTDPTPATEPATGFAVRGVLPWHNFLSGPSAWNLADYEAYLDTCQAHGINLIAFHNYTGGAERYVTYVEPMIRMAWRDVVPEAYFDHSLSARWGYRPLRISEMPFGAADLLPHEEGSDAFGAAASVSARSTEEHYARAKQQMRAVLRMAHERGIRMAMGFEFGVHPPEYLSVRLSSAPHAGWYGTASFVPDPTSPQARELLYATIDDILDSYPGIDWIWLWLNEHTMFGVDVTQGVAEGAFGRQFSRHQSLFAEAEPEMRFLGVWALEYIRLAYEHIRARAPEVGIAISGWGGGNQLTPILEGLDRALPSDIVFTSLNPNQGEEGHAPVLARIARRRRVWAIPWLEGDRGLWHFQPRVFDLAEQLGQARRDSLDGVLAIHWRTEETRFNFRSFAHFARQPADTEAAEELLLALLAQEFGRPGAELVGPTLVEMDREHWMRPMLSEEYYSYEPTWGRLSPDLERRIRALLPVLEQAAASAAEARHRENLEWMRKEMQVTLLLHEVGLEMERTYRTRHAVLSGEISRTELEALRPELQTELAAAPVADLFATYAAKARSRGEWGVFSAINQKLWLEYRDLLRFVNEKPAGDSEP